MVHCLSVFALSKVGPAFFHYSRTGLSAYIKTGRYRLNIITGWTTVFIQKPNSVFIHIFQRFVKVNLSMFVIG